MTDRINQVEQAVDRVIEATGGEIRLAMPLGLGKPNRFVNALYARVEADPSLSLDIYTALSLGKPGAGSDLEKRSPGRPPDASLHPHAPLVESHPLRGEWLPYRQASRPSE